MRALRHAAERAVILAEGASLTAEDFSLPRGAPVVIIPTPPVGSELNLDRQEKQMVERALKEHGFNISLAAAALGLSRGALYRRMEKYGL